MSTRRVVLKNAGAYAGASLMAWHAPAQSQSAPMRRMPDEGEPHLRT
jgi:hypothetical protein